MIIDLPLLPDSGRKHPFAARPIRMGFFHFSNNNLSIRKQCAREVGMYDTAATKSEDVDLCFRVALSPKWVAWREDAAEVRHKGRRTLWGLVSQMWGWGFYLGYPYSKTGIRGAYLYLLNPRDHSLTARYETENFPVLLCAFPTDFYFFNALMVLLVFATFSGRLWTSLIAGAALLWVAPRYLYDVRRVRLSPWGRVKLAMVHYATNLAFTIAAFLGALRHRVILIPASVFRADPRDRAEVGGKDSNPIL